MIRIRKYLLYRTNGQSYLRQICKGFLYNSNIHYHDRNLNNQCLITKNMTTIYFEVISLASHHLENDKVYKVLKLKILIITIILSNWKKYRKVTQKCSFLPFYKLEGLVFRENGQTIWQFFPNKTWKSHVRFNDIKINI